jgi:hypothetical protein
LRGVLYGLSTIDGISVVGVHAIEGSEKKVEHLYKPLRGLAGTSVASYSEKDLKLIHNFLSMATTMLRKATAKFQQ